MRLHRWPELLPLSETGAYVCVRWLAPSAVVAFVAAVLRAGRVRCGSQAHCGRTPEERGQVNIFTRMWMEPGTKRLSWARLVGWWLTIPGAFVATVAVIREPLDVDRALIGMGMVAFGVILYGLTTWRRISFGAAEVERGDDNDDLFPRPRYRRGGGLSRHETRDIDEMDRRYPGEDR